MTNTPRYKVVGLDAIGCPICGEYQSGCSLWSTNILCRKSEDEQVDGYRRSHMVDDTWAAYVPADMGEHNKLIADYEKRYRFTPSGTKSKSQKKSKKVSSYDLTWEALQKRYEDWKKIFSKYRVDKYYPHQEALQSRHPKLDTSKFAGGHGELAASLEARGLVKEGFYWKGIQDRILIPIRNITGHIVAVQTRAMTADSAEYGKYLWLTNGEGSHLNEFSEWPIQVAKPSSPTDTAVFIEGVLKPLVLFEKLDRSTFCLGGVGAQFTKSKETIRTLVNQLTTVGIKRWLLACDAGWSDNADVTRHYKKLTDMLAEWGVTLEYVECGDKDADEVSDAEAQRLFKGNSIDAKAFTAELLESQLKKQIQTVGGHYKPSMVELDSARDAVPLVVNAAQSVFLDCSAVGAGKTHSAEAYVTEHNMDLIYISQSPRALPTKYLAENAYVAPSRHRGLVKTEKLDGAMKPIYRIAKPSETPDTSASCENAEWHRSMTRLGVGSQAACEQCPFFKACGEGGDANTASNYLYNRNKGVPEEARVVATSVQGFKDSYVRGSNPTVIMIDEAEQLTASPVEISIPAAKFDNWLATVPEDERGDQLEIAAIKQVSADGTQEAKVLFKLNPAYFEDLMLSASALDGREAYEAQRHAQAKAAGKEVGEAPVVQNYTDIALTLNSTGLFRHEERLYRKTINPQVQNILQLAASVDNVKLILADATMDPESLMQRLQLNSDDCLVYGVPDEVYSNLEIVNIRTDGFNRNQRAERAEYAADRIKSGHFYWASQNNRLAIAGPKDTVGDGDINFFSNSRGSNAYQDCNSLLVLGTPKINLGVLAEEYNLMVSPPCSYKEYCDRRNFSELKQVIGRLRAHRRRGTRLEVAIVGLFNLKCFKDMGYAVKTVWADLEGYCESTTLGVKSLYDIVVGLSSSFGKKVTQASLANKIGMCAMTVTRTLKRLGKNFSAFKKIVESALSGVEKWATLGEEARTLIRTKPVEEWTEEELETHIYPSIDCVGAKGVKMADWQTIRQRAVSNVSIRTRDTKILNHPLTTYNLSKAAWTLMGKPTEEQARQFEEQLFPRKDDRSKTVDWLLAWQKV